MQTRKIWIVTAALLALGLLVSCAGQNPRKAGEDNSERYDYTMKLTDTTDMDGDYTLRDVSGSGDNIYFFYADNSGSMEDQRYRIDIRDAQFNLLRQIEYEPYGEAYFFDSIAVGVDGSFWIMERLSDNEPVSDVIEAIERGAKTRYLRYFDADGVSQLIFNPFEKYGMNGFNLMAVDEHGRIYIRFGGTFDESASAALIDTNGEVVSLWEDDFAGYIVMTILDDGRPLVLDGHRNIYEIMDEGEVKLLHSLNKSYNMLCAGIGNTAYLSVDQELYRLSLDTMAVEVIASWSDMRGIGLASLVVLSEDTMYGQLNTGQLVTFHKSSDLVAFAEEDNRQVIRVAAYSPEPIFRQLVIDFNRTNYDYKLEVTDYSQYDTDDNPVGGVFKLNLDIIAGDIPDLFIWGQSASIRGFDPTVYINKGIFANLYDFLDSDDDFNRESFVPSIIKAVESPDGGLYELPMEFVIHVVACSHSDITLEKWNMDEFYSEFERHKDAKLVFGTGAVKEMLLYLFLSNNWDEYVDWQARTCDFESESFIKLLEFCAGQDENLNDYMLPNEAIAERRQYLYYNALSNVSAIQKFKAVFQDEVTFIGFPVSRGSGNSILLTKSISIYKDSDYRDICWEIIKQFYDKEFQLNSLYLFPTNAEAMNERLAHPEEYEASGRGIGYSTPEGDSFMVTFTDATEDECAQVRRLIESLDRIYRSNASLLTIILEESAPYFNGDKTAQDVAHVIQNRIAIYLSE